MAPPRRSWIGRCTALPTGYYVERRGSFGWGYRGARTRLQRVNVLDMTSHGSISRRSFLAAAAATPLALAAPAGKNIPVGIELYSVRDEMTKDTLATVRAIAKMGYEVVEFYGPYYAWTPDFVKDVRKVMDETGIRCNSTHNDARNFRPENIQKAIDYNKTLGAKYVVMASSGNVDQASTAGRASATRSLRRWRSCVRRDCAPAITITRRNSNRWTASGRLK